ncbi:MAG: fimbrillin family protein [Marinifilaceae bacterium]|nr:fimbrillin family protein [Marinifilaceae bacterium]
MSKIGRRIYLLVIIASLFAASCASTEDDGPNGDSRAISFTPNTGSRAAVNDASDMDAFSVWGWYGKDAQITNNVFDGITVSKSGNAWTYTGGSRYWLPGYTYNFHAVYPAELNGTSVTTDGNFTINNFDASFTGEQAVDLMTASRLAMSGDAAEQVAFTFSHELVKVDVIIQAMLSVKVTIHEVKIHGISTSGTFTLNTANATRAWDVQPAVNSSNTPYSNTTPTELDGDGTTNQTNAFSALLLIPQSINNAKLSITYQREGETASTTQEIALNQQTSTWNAGNSYRYTLLFETDNITFSGFTVEAWNTRYSGGDINITGI